MSRFLFGIRAVFLFWSHMTARSTRSYLVNYTLSLKHYAPPLYGLVITISQSFHGN